MQGYLRCVAAAWISVIGLYRAERHESLAGVPNRCDLARIEARGTILGEYQQLLSELDRGIEEAKASGRDPANSSVRVASGEVRSIDVVSLAAELDSQRQSDLGYVDKQVLRGCAEDSNAVENARRTAELATARGISLVMSRHGLDKTELLQILPRS